MSNNELKVHKIGTNTTTYLKRHIKRWENTSIKENTQFSVLHDVKNGVKSAHLVTENGTKIELFKDNKRKKPPKISQELNLLEDFGIIKKVNSDYILIAKTKSTIISQIMESLKIYLNNITLDNINLNSLILTILHDRYSKEEWFSQIEKAFQEYKKSSVFKGDSKFYGWWQDTWRWIKEGTTDAERDEIHDLISNGIEIDILATILITITKLKNIDLKTFDFITQKGLNDASLLFFIKNIFSVSSKSINIPPFQREYVWDESILRILIEDIVQLLDQKNEKIFLGTFVFGDATKHLELLDGQQRLITIMMVLSISALICKKNSVPIPSEVFQLFERIKENKLTGSTQLEGLINPLLLLNPSIESFVSSKTNASVRSFGIAYKELMKLDWSSNYKEYWKKLLLGINILTYTHKQGNYVDIFVKLNTTSQELSFLSLLKSYLMVKVGGKLDVVEKTSNYEAIDRKLRSSYFYKNFENGKKIPEFLKFLHDYLCISQNKTENLTESCTNKSEGIVFSFFREKIFDGILKHEAIKLDTKTEFINKSQIEKIIDFLSLITEYYNLLINPKKHGDEKLKKENFLWVMDFITLFKKAKNFHPLIVHIIQDYYGDHKNQKELTKARQLLWNLERLYISRFKTGSSYTLVLAKIGKDLESWCEFDALNNKLLEMVKESSDVNIQFLSDEHIFSAAKDFKIHLFHRLELAKRLQYKPNQEIDKIKRGNKEAKELMEFYLNKIPNINIELEHIIPTKYNKTLVTIKDQSVIKDRINTLGNHCLLNKEINNKMKNKTYKEKQAIFKKYKPDDFFFSIETVTIASGTKIEGAYEMKADSSGIIPKLNSWKKRNTNITKTLKTIYGIS